ncbi:MAG: hypothetical protein OXF01_17155 [Gemmatimonadetes bacterium]|nr:hypothetical protein [Gemmatimonadota bacterium]
MFTKAGEQHEGFLRFASARHAASWVDSFQMEQSVEDQPFRAWAKASRGGAPSVRTVELKGYRITWNTDEDDFSRRSGDFPGSRVIRIPYGSLTQLRGQPPRGRTQFLTVQLRREGAGDGETPRRPEHVWSGARQSLILRYTEDWRGTTIEVEGPDDARATVAFRDVERVEFAVAPAGLAPGSGRLFGTMEDRSGNSFTGLVTWDGDKVLRADTLDGWFDGPLPRPIPLRDIRSIEGVGREAREGETGGARLTLATGEVFELTKDPGARGSPVAEIMVVDPGLGTVTVGWEDFGVLHFHGAAQGPARPQGDGAAPEAVGRTFFAASVPLRGTVVTDAGEEIAGRIRWSTLKEWSWDVLSASLGGTEMAVRFANIRSIEQLAVSDLPPDGTTAPTHRLGRVRVTLLDGRTYELLGHGDLGSGNTGILVWSAPPGGESDSTAGEPDSAQAPASDSGDAGPTGDARPSWRLINWEDVRMVRFEHMPPGEPES